MEQLIDEAWDAFTASVRLKSRCQRNFGMSRPALIDHLAQACDALRSVHATLERDELQMDDQSREVESDAE